MADIPRAPLVSHSQRKRPIAPVDYFSRPLTLGINPNARVAQLSDSSPPVRRRIHADVSLNLLVTTLAGGAPAAPDLPMRSGKVFDSAPGRRWQPDSLQSQGLIVYDGPEATIAALTDSAPQRRRQQSIEQYTNLLSTTLVQSSRGLPLIAGQVYGSAPTKKRSAYAFDSPALLGTTLQSALAQLSLPLLAMRIDAAAPAVRYQVRIEALSRPLTLGVNPNAAVVQFSESATARGKAAYAFDPPNLLLGTLAESLGLPITAGRVDASAPILKYQVRIESLSRPVTLGVNPNALIAQLSTSAPPPKKAAYTFDPPNLIGNTLTEPLELPRFAGRLDWSAPPPNVPKYLDDEPWFSPDTPSVQISPHRVNRVVLVADQTRRVSVKLQ